MVWQRGINKKNMDYAIKCANDLEVAIDILTINERLKMKRRAFDLEVIRLK